MSEREGGIAVMDRQREELKEPPRYSVILLNDDFTPMEFVTGILIGIFRHEKAKAERIMMDVHEKGRGVAGIYSHEIAETKVVQVMMIAEQAGYPLQAVMEPEG